MKRADIVGTFVVAACLVLFSAYRAPIEAQQVRVAILPFAMHTGENLDYLNEGVVDMLATRISVGTPIRVAEKSLVSKAVKEKLGASYTEEGVRSVGRDLEVDFVAFGSFTKIADNVSIDMKIMDVRGEEPPVAVFAQSLGMDSVIPSVGGLAQNLQNAILGKPIVPLTFAVGQPPPPPPSLPPPQAAVSTPTTVQLPQREPEGPTSPYIVVKKPEERQPGIIRTPEEVKKSQVFWQSQFFDTEFRGMDVGDVDGDGDNEVVVLDRHIIMVFKVVEGELEEEGRIAGEAYEDYLALDVADINGNGTPEIFVTSMRGEYLDSFVVERSGGRYARMDQKLPFFLAVTDVAGEDPKLLAQSLGVKTAFGSGVTELTWDGSSYVAKADLKLPEEVNVYGLTLADVEPNGQKDIVYLDSGDYLKVISFAGETIWKSDERFGGSDKFFEKDFEGVQDSETDVRKEKIYLSHRVLTADLDQDGKTEFIVGRNMSATGRFLKELKFYNKSEIYNLTWSGISLEENWRTKKIDGYLIDYQVKDADNDGEDELVVAVLLKYDIMEIKVKSVILIYELGLKET
jgi:TolB-like protein